MDGTCAKLTGSGSEATAAPKAIVIILIVSGGNDALEKSPSSASISKMSAKKRAGRCNPHKLSQCQQIWRQAVWGEHVTQPIANLYTYRTAVEAIDLNAMWMLAGHERGSLVINLVA